MQALVIYESMFGNTHLIAKAIGAGLAETHEVSVQAIHDVDRAAIEEADLVVVGGPTHVHGMSRPSTRKGAVDVAAKSNGDVELEPDAERPGLREWFATLEPVDAKPAAAFDTRIDAAPALTGRASKSINRKLRRHGFKEVVEPESFLVTKQNHLKPDELTRAKQWGQQLARATVTTAVR